MIDPSKLTTFSDVKVFAVNWHEWPADASYRNLFWETFTAPDILFNIYSPPIVSLYDKIIKYNFIFTT